MAHRGEKSRLRRVRRTRLVAGPGQFELVAFALGDVLAGALQIGRLVSISRGFGPQIQGADFAAGRDNAVIEIDLLAFQSLAQRVNDGFPVEPRNTPQQSQYRHRPGALAQAEHATQLGRAFDQLALRQPAKIADPSDPLRLSKPPLADNEISQRLMRAQQIAHPVRQHRPIDRLVDKIGGPDPIGSLDRVDIVERRGHQHRRVAPARQCADRLAHLKAAHLGHHHIEDDEIGPVLVESLQRRRAVFRLHDLEPRGFEHLPLEKPFGFVIIGDQDQRAGPLKWIGHHATCGRRAVNAACARR